MNKKQFKKSDLIQILIKKANGFFYKEEQVELEKPQKKIKLNENSTQNYKNISFFENFDRGAIQKETSDDMIEISNGQDNSTKQIFEDFAVIKKKITTHFIPPDMHAIKILFEIFGEKVGEDNIENLTDEELIELKNKLLREISNED